MKTFISFKLLLVTLLLVYCSCSHESGLTVPEQSHQNTPLLKEGKAPENPDNPYDLAGKAHAELLDAYFDSVTLPTTLEQVIARVGLLSQNSQVLQTLDTRPFAMISAERAQYILSQPQNAIPEVFAQAAASERAQKSLKSFTDSLLLLCTSEQNYSLIYNYITGFEELVLHDALFTASDKKFLLTSSSIARFAASKKRRPKRNQDTDWELNIFHVAGSIEGQNQSPAAAVTSALCLGIAANR